MAKEKYSYGYAQEKYKPLKQKEEKYNLKLKKVIIISFVLMEKK